jgi:hypothetical protein
MKSDAKKAFLGEMKQKLSHKMGESYGGLKVKQMKPMGPQMPKQQDLEIQPTAVDMLREKMGMKNQDHHLGAPKMKEADKSLVEQKEEHGEMDSHANVFEKVKDLHPDDMKKVVDLLHGLLEKRK